MSHIQRILERAEREGTIRPSVITDPAAAPAGVPVTPVDAAPLAAPASPDIAPPAPAPALAPPPAARRVAPSALDARLREVLRPGAHAADQYRALRTRVQQAAHGRPVSVLLVSSPGRGEGRTQTAAGLALIMAQEFDRRVCLVDADLRHPDLRERFGLPPGPGLSDVLAGQAALDEALIYVEDLHVTVLPGGTPSADAELLGTPAMRRTLQALRARFDRIVIDGPVVLPVSDVALLSPLVDGVMLVVRSGVTTRPAIQDALDGIASDRLLGLMLNDAQ